MFDVFISSASHVTETMRFRDVEQTNNNTRLLFSLITDNHPLLVNLTESSRRIDLHNEMNYFMVDRISFLLSKICDHVSYHFNLKNHPMDDVKCFKIGESTYNNSELLNKQTLQRLEFDVDRMIASLEYSDTMKQVSDLPLFDRKSILVFLINKINWFIHFNRTSKLTDSSQIILTNLYDFGSIRCLVILAALVVKVAFSLFNQNCSFDHVGVKERKYRLINDDFTRLVSLGNMSYANIICCYKNMNLLEFAVENKNGSSSQDIREFLYNLLIIDRVVQ